MSVGSPHAVFIALLWVLGVVNLANGAWMLAHAWSWFSWIPGVTDTGDVNAHFVHDVGVVYAICGYGFIWCARHPSIARPVFLGITLFFVGHALGHVFEILLGALPSDHWLIDLPLVFAPALLLCWLAMPARWRRLAGTVAM